jgi:hypothetical protein
VQPRGALEQGLHWLHQFPQLVAVLPQQSWTSSQNIICVLTTNFWTTWTRMRALRQGAAPEIIKICIFNWNEYIMEHSLNLTLMYLPGIRPTSYYSRESVSKQVTNGSKTDVMDVIGFLCVSIGSSTVQLHKSLGSRRACACSEAGFSSQYQTPYIYWPILELRSYINPFGPNSSRSFCIVWRFYTITYLLYDAEGLSTGKEIS